ncbi:hypothetical protein [Clostridium uliginosum]|uniref:Major tropism determinant N-terminal domain-containing protein n=1 Tax=Clostridium uliginosum TaxID=119641 RepID=A0A1I1KZ07_9CLOT|nr:hypothetical protein [Clostridium uliginosum]SFC63938.1 hypothetical protein SAMN05421842_106143 [Clostridium uliginosum]
MANKIQIKRGLKVNLPVLNVGEPAFTTDTKEFFIGDGLSNIEFAKQSNLETTNTHLKEIVKKQDKFTENSNGKLLYNGVKVGATKASELELEAIAGMSAKNVQAGIAEAFQYASNGKTTIAGVVGGVTANNTYAEIMNRIQIDKNTMASNLNNKGVSANGVEALASLANKIGNIPIGRKIVIGNTPTFMASVYNISGFDFIPRFCFMWGSRIDGRLVMNNSIFDGGRFHSITSVVDGGCYSYDINDKYNLGYGYINMPIYYGKYSTSMSYTWCVIGD